MSANEYKKRPENPAEADVHWEGQAKSPLFRSKRAAELATLLKIRFIMDRGNIKEQNGDKLREILERADGRQAAGQIVRLARSKTVGTAIADLTVCGAVPPYGPILAGKLAAMLSVGPEVVKEYRRRYRHAPSVIASSMAGKAVFRPADLVYITATSLYGDRPTQYDRISIPGELLGGKNGKPLKYRFFGERTYGFGTFQYSDTTIRSVMDFLNAESNDARVNYIFGEGANPKMRALREGLSKLGFDEEKELQHGHQKPIYGVSLIINAKEYLLQMVKTPKYLYSFQAPRDKTQAIIDWWLDRWVRPRIRRPDVLETVRQHDLVYPIKHGARVQLPRTDIAQLKLF